MKRTLIGIFVLGGFFFCHNVQGDERPNILFILADDLGYGDVGCYNSESKVPTPHVDRLAGEGIRFTDAHSPSTVCTPPRYSLLTRRMAFRHGLRGVFDGAGGPCMIEETRLTLPGIRVHNSLLWEMAYRVDVLRLGRKGDPSQRPQGCEAD
jgi:arylsulfatase A